MNNGCICCTVRGDLVRIIDGLMRRKGKFDAIIVETTGLADPAPVAQTFFMDENVGRKAKLDAVVTVADAKWLQERLKDAPEAKNQIAFADVILLNKTDLVTPDELREVEARIRGINPYAKVHRTERCRIALPEVLGRNAFDLDRILEIEPEFLEGDGHAHAHDHHHDHDHGHDHDHHHHDGGGLKHYHDEEMQSVSIRTDKPLNPDKFFPWVQDLVQKEGPSILRCKGILAFKDDDERFVFQGVHMILDGDHQRPWKAGEKRESRLVFIGRKLPEDKIRQGLRGLPGVTAPAREVAARAAEPLAVDSQFTMSNSAVLLVPAAPCCARVLLAARRTRFADASPVTRPRQTSAGKRAADAFSLRDDGLPHPDEGWMERRQAHSFFRSRLRRATTLSRVDRDLSRRSTVAIFGCGPTKPAPGSGTGAAATARAAIRLGGRGPDLPSVRFAPQSRVRHLLAPSCQDRF